MPRMIRSPALVSCVRLALVFSFALAVALGCKGSSAPGPSGSASAAVAKAWPSAIAQADEMKRAGASWTNEEIRIFYNELVSAIGPADEQRKREGMPIEERARKAFQARHDARMLSRAMMASALEVQILQKRDQEKYGNPDGPTFEHLVESAKKKGTIGDAIYEGIITSAQRTDEATNAAFGVKKAP